MKLQGFDHRSSTWERPTQDWVCGHAADGTPCRLGPDGRGKCRTTHECAPHREGDSWVCTRTEAAGGPCDGPGPDGVCSQPVVPCKPRRSRRARVRAISRAVAIASIGLVVIVLTGWRLGSLILPRPLIAGHAALNDCAICHPRFEEGPFRWVLSAPDDGGTRDEKCMKCHRKDAAGSSLHGLLRWVSLTAGGGGMQDQKCLKCHKDAAEASSPHGLSQSEIEALSSQRKASGSSARRLAPGVSHVPITVACASCHAEHRGRNANLTIMSNVKCQACHQEAFRSFADDHPDFGAYPFSRRAKIVFDHTAHLTRNFVKAAVERAPKVCTDCHYPDAAGRTMLVRSFEETCGQCHDGRLHEDKRDAATEAFELLTVPGLDTDTLRARGFDIGEWPDRSERHITPFMEIFIGSDPEAAAELEALRRADLLHLEKADDPELERAAKLAWRIKSLFADLRSRGPGAVMPGIEEAVGETLPRETRAALFASIPRDVIVAAQRDWFPELDADLARHRAGAPLRTDSPAAPPVGRVAAPGPRAEPASNPKTKEWTDLGGFSRDDYAINYRPIAHRDPFLRAWMDLAVRLGRGRPGTKLLGLLRARTAPGGCGKCHSVDRLPDGKRVVNWKPGHERTEPVGFTRFAHSPHLSITESDCAHCHPLASAGGDVAAAYESLEPTKFVAEFEPVHRSTCARCHDGRVATDLCTSCHYYHVSRNRARRIAASTTGN